MIHEPPKQSLPAFIKLFKNSSDQKDNSRHKRERSKAAIQQVQRRKLEKQSKHVWIDFNPSRKNFYISGKPNSLMSNQQKYFPLRNHKNNTKGKNIFELPSQTTAKE